MSDWEPRRLTPSDHPWDAVDRLEVMLQQNPARISAEDLEAIRQHQNTPQVETTGTALQPGLGGYQNAPTTINLDGQSRSTYAPNGIGFAVSGKALDIQQGVVDFVRYFLPGSEFDPDEASPAFDLGMVLIQLLAKIVTIPGGALLIRSIMTALGRDVPQLGTNLNQHSDLSLFEAIDSRAGKLIRRLLDGFEAVPVATPQSLQRVEDWIHTVADNYRALDDAGIFDEPDFLSRLFRNVSDQMGESHYPGQKAGWVGVVFYLVGLVFERENSDFAERLFESGDLFFNLSESFNLGRELRNLHNIESLDDLFRVIDNAPLTPLETGLTAVDGVQGLMDYVDSTAALWDDPSLNPYIAGDEVWPRRISVMFSGIEGILSAGLAVVTLASGGAVLAIAPILMIAIGICGLITILLDNWEWVSGGLEAWKDSLSMLTQIIIPYRTYQIWHWFDDNLGRPVREHILQPIGNWAQNTWIGLTGWAQSLAGE